jgi:hypothetical protein
MTELLASLARPIRSNDENAVVKWPRFLTAVQSSPFEV